MRSARLGSVMSTVLLTSSLIEAQMVPVAVSPGDTEESTRIAETCPTFNWGAVDGATGYELVLLGQAEVPEAGAELEVLFRVNLPGSAHGWTPSLDRCLARGRVYAWTVRALTERGVSAWSEANVFEVSRFSALARGTNRARRPAETVDQSVTADLRGAAVDRLRDQLRDGGAAEDRNAPENVAIRRPNRNLMARRLGDPSARDLRERLAKVKQNRQRSRDTQANLAAPGAANPSLSVSNDISLSATSNIFKDGQPLLWDDGGDANLATGRLALSNNTTGWGNTATGYSALDYNSNGIHNTATGAYALYNNSSGAFNTAAGFVALESNTTGNDNVGMGWGALQNNTSGFFNVGIGSYSLRDGTGSGNIGIGYRAGFYPLGNNNIHIGHEGYTSDNSTTRIGQLQGAAYMAGVYGAPLAGTSAHPVYVDNYGKFGVGGPSSIRFKEDVEDLGERSSALMELRPVSFHFKQGEGASEASSKSWGLIAEEVAQVFPELVTYDDEGKPNGVRYYLLTPLLLNELQKQHRTAEALRHEIQELRARLARLEGSRGTGPMDR